jgi:hypothetical protein
LRLSPSPCAGRLGSNNPLRGGSVDVCSTVPGIASRRVRLAIAGKDQDPLKEHGFPLFNVSSSAVSRAVLPMLNGAGLSLHGLAQLFPALVHSRRLPSTSVMFR